VRHIPSDAMFHPQILHSFVYLRFCIIQRQLISLVH
jgi:hypothetical protein